MSEQSINRYLDHAVLKPEMSTEVSFVLGFPHGTILSQSKAADADCGVFSFYERNGQGSLTYIKVWGTIMTAEDLRR